MKVIVILIIMAIATLTNLVTYSFSYLCFTFLKSKTKNQFLANWWYGNKKIFVLFLYSEYVEFSRYVKDMSNSVGFYQEILLHVLFLIVYSFITKINLIVLQNFNHHRKSKFGVVITPCFISKWFNLKFEYKNFFLINN